MFVAIFAYNVNSCALDISLYFVCEKKTNKSWHRKKPTGDIFWLVKNLIVYYCLHV